MRTVAALTFRLHRFEVLAVWLGSFILTAAAIVMAVRLQGVGVSPECFGNIDVHGTPNPSMAGCEAVLQRFAEIDAREVGVLYAILFVFPALAGLVLGTPAVSRELERGTAALPWTLDGSRWRWLAGRAALLLALLLVALAPLALATDYLQGVRHPAADPTMAFGDDVVRGGVLVAIGAAAFGIGVLMGLVLGRQLPSLIVAGLLSTSLFAGVTVVMDQWSASVAEVRGIEEGRPGDRSIDTRFQAADGTLVAMSDVLKLQPDRLHLPEGTIDDQWLNENYTEVSILVPRERYPQAVAIRSGLLVGGSLLALLGSLWLVERRRPG